MDTYTKQYPLIPVRDGIVFPGTENVLAFGREKSVEAIKAAMDSDKLVVLVMQKNASIDEPEPEDLYQVGVLASVKNVVTGEKGEITALVHGEDKVAIEAYVQTDPYCIVETSHTMDILVEDEEVHAMIKHISGQIKRAINLGKTIDFVFLMNILNVHNPLDFSNQVAMVIDLREHERQEVLEEHNLKLRLKKIGRIY
jgi:ATP-dependent Lon protease